MGSTANFRTVLSDFNAKLPFKVIYFGIIEVTKGLNSTIY